MAAELLLPTWRAADINNAPYSGAKWKFYATGTTTPQEVFADAALETSLGSVVTADSAGKFVPIYFDASLSYRGVCENATGSAILHDIDPINPGVLAQLAGETGAASVGYRFDAPGAVLRSQAQINAETVSVAAFGAKCDGTTDDTAAVQAAVDYAVSLDGRAVLTVPGTCRLTAAINIDLPDDDIMGQLTFRGIGAGAGFKRTTAGVMFSSTLASPGTISDLDIPPSHYPTFENLSFECDNADTATYVFAPDKFLRVRLRNCNFRSVRLIDAPDSYLQSWRLEDCRAQGRGTGEWCLIEAAKAFDLHYDVTTETGGTGVKLATLEGGWIGGLHEGCSGYLADISGANGVTFAPRYTEGNTLGDIKLGREGGASRGVTFNGGAYLVGTDEFGDPDWWAIELGYAFDVTVNSAYGSYQLFENSAVPPGHLKGSASVGPDGTRFKVNPFIGTVAASASGTGRVAAAKVRAALSDVRSAAAAGEVVLPVAIAGADLTITTYYSPESVLVLTENAADTVNGVTVPGGESQNYLTRRWMCFADGAWTTFDAA